MRAYDDLGKEVFPVTINTICPIAYSDLARQIALDHMRSIEGAKNSVISEMLQIRLAPIGQAEPTHVFCSRDGFTNQVDMQIDTLANQNQTWCGTRAFSLADDPDEIKSLLCCIVCDSQQVLSHLGLEVV